MSGGGRDAGAGVLAGRRLLVCEDEFYVAVRLERALLDAGASVTLFASLAPALAHAAGDAAIDAALLDINLRGDLSFPLADALLSRGVPLMFLSGYDTATIPPLYRDVARLQKPVTLTQLTQKLDQLLHR
ncbi:response regulator [Sphingomonas sp. BK580]|uniref:response regulator n=1 Tax=Sphingomonas sp. BK580 TaxID=2586972 RepID=UPI00161F4B51|nr:response regulator [Sphingomonas sp. BK580]MBB3694506.1 CheY-like chemotaxis protein [Sphingomonas sp. BK580]